MPSRQFEHLQESSRRQLAAMIPHDCPIYVMRRGDSRRGFTVQTIDDVDSCAGRYEVVAAWITGFVASWKRVRRVVSSGLPAPVDAVSRTYLVRK